jgi:hypothetical protein
MSRQPSVSRKRVPPQAVGWAFLPDLRDGPRKKGESATTGKNAHPTV